MEAGVRSTFSPDLTLRSARRARLEGWAIRSESVAHASRRPLRGLLSMRSWVLPRQRRPLGVADVGAVATARREGAATAESRQIGRPAGDRHKACMRRIAQ